LPRRREVLDDVTERLDGVALCIDPGKTIGLAWGALELANEWNRMVVGFGDVRCEPGKQWKDGDVNGVMQVLSKIAELGGEEVKIIVVEKTVIIPGRVKRSGDILQTAGVEAMLRLALATKWWNGQLIEQMASSAKGIVTDARLRKLDLWIPGNEKRHIRDALRHLVLLMRRIRKGEVKV
jgi:hypothetical protein